jgi:trimeric autotransporter adhesin
MAREGPLRNQADDAAGPVDEPVGATVAGRITNRAKGQASSAGGGLLNIASGASATVGGGVANDASGGAATVGGGQNNQASGNYSTVGGGHTNVASGNWATVPGGRRGKAIHVGSFVWADSTDADFSSQATNQFRVRSTGGVQFVSGDGTGVRLAAGGGSWASISDRSVKENMAAVDGTDILRRLSAIPITRWNLTAQDSNIKHVGPMAQDFYAAFGLGEDERYINTADVDGIALVSIQALHELVTALERKTADLERIAASVEDLRARLTRFEQTAQAH